MQSEHVKILDHAIVQQKLLRMAFEIWENHADSKELYICGVEGSGAPIARLLFEILQDQSPLKLHFVDMTMDKSQPFGHIQLSHVIPENAEIVIVDDVANTGYVLFHAMSYLAPQKPKKLEIAVLVNRMHKSFPIQPNYIGHNVSTTLQDHILVEQDTAGEFVVYLK